MIDTFVKAVEKGIELLRERSRRKREVFELAIEPIYRELPELVDDYLGVLNSADAMLRDLDPREGASNLYMLDFYNNMLKSYRDQRQKLKHRRLAVQALAEELLSSSSDKDCIAFAISVADMFKFDTTSTTLPSPEELADPEVRRRLRTYTSLIADAFERLADIELEQGERSVYSREKLDLSDTINAFEQSWVQVTMRYARVRRSFLAIQT